MRRRPTVAVDATGDDGRADHRRAGARPLPPPTKITAIGDSVMLGSQPALAATFGPMLQLDAAVSRQAEDAVKVAGLLGAAGQLGDRVVVHLGTNGIIRPDQFEELMRILAAVPRVVIVNTSVPRPWEAPVNELLAAAVPTYPNAVLLDWKTVASQHPESSSRTASTSAPRGRWSTPTSSPRACDSGPRFSPSARASWSRPSSSGPRARAPGVVDQLFALRARWRRSACAARPLARLLPERGAGIVLRNMLAIVRLRLEAAMAFLNVAVGCRAQLQRRPVALEEPHDEALEPGCCAGAHRREPHQPVEAEVVRRDLAAGRRIGSPGLPLNSYSCHTVAGVSRSSSVPSMIDLVALLGDVPERAVGAHEVQPVEAEVHELPARQHVADRPVAQDRPPARRAR